MFILYYISGDTGGLWQCFLMCLIEITLNTLGFLILVSLKDVGIRAC